MVREISHSPKLLDPFSALTGFIGGSLIASGIFGSLGIVIQAGFLILGILTILYSILPCGKDVYMLTVIFFSLTGIVVGFFMEAAGFGIPYSSIVFIAAVVVFTVRFALAEREIFE